MTFRRHSNAYLTGAAIAAFAMAWSGPASAQKALSVKPDAIGGKVTGANGPEAGVWVIAETTDLPTKYAKMVVTNDAGQFVIPQLPSAKYKIWVRGYGLVDSDKQDATPGKTIDLKAKPAPSAAAAAEYYPGMYWYAMLKIPPASEFPGSDKSPTGMPASMDSQATWVDSIKNSCQSCHALGSQNIRHPHVKELGEFKNSEEMWERRVQSGQAMNNMALTLGRLGPQRAYKMFADWTDRIAAGELPFDKPERPKGVERNVVITSWAWAKKGEYLHDEVSTDKRNPTLNANGKIYGSPEESSDDIPVLDPVKNTTSFIHEPYVDPQTPSAKDDPMAPSVFWGDEPIWDGHTSIHNPMMDEKGRVWFTARIRRAPNPASCKEGSDLELAQVMPLKDSARQASVYDPKTEKWATIDTCFSTHHLVFTPDDKLWFSQGQPYSGVVGWLDVKKFDATGDAMKSEGWTPVVANVSGTGKREPFVAPRQADRTRQGQMGQGRLLRHHAERQGRRDLGPDDGPGLHAYCATGLPGPYDPWKRSGQDRRLRALPIASGHLWLTRRGRRFEGRSLDRAIERTDGQLRSFQVQGKARRTERRDRRPVLRGLDALSVAGTPVQDGRRSQRQRQPRLLYLG